jgi:hypothetical protein
MKQLPSEFIKEEALNNTWRNGRNSDEITTMDYLEAIMDYLDQQSEEKDVN